MKKTAAANYTTFVLVAAGMLAIFIMRTRLAVQGEMPRLFDLFSALTIAGSLIVWLKG